MKQLLTILRKWKYFGFDRETLDDFQKDVNFRNLTALRSFCLSFSVLNFIFFVLEFFWGSTNFYTLLFTACSFGMLLFFTLYFDKNIKANISVPRTSMYVTITACIAYGITILWSTYMHPQDYGVFIICMLFLLPCVINERPARALLQVILAVVIFSFLSFYMKPFFYAIRDTIHAIIAALISTILSYNRNRQTLEEIVATRKLEKLNTELKYLNTIDPLTGIFNRGKIFTILAEMTEKNAQQHKPIACAILDLDNFKTINDTYGHPQGDIILKNTGAIITNLLADYPEVYAGRVGGEEFMILAYDMDEKEFGNLCLKTIAFIHDIEITISEYGNPVFASASCGFCVLEKNIAHLYSYADKALYYSKNNGKNCVWQYSTQTEQCYAYTQ